MEDEGVSVAPPRRSALSTPSELVVSAAEAVPASLTTAEAVPASLSPVDAVPAPLSPAEADSAPLSPEEDAIIPETTSTIVPPPTDDLDLPDIHPQGSSRATGGILRGRAAAGFYSPADEVKMFDGIGIAKMTVKIYTSDSNPLYLNHNNMVPSSKVTIKMNPNLGPILDNISQRYPAIQGIC